MSETRAVAPISAMDAFAARLLLSQQEINDLVTLGNTAIKSEAMMEGVTPYKYGTLSGSHFADPAVDGVGELGASADYAAANHENHPTKAGWFLDTINLHARRIYGRLLRNALRGKGAR
jgi:hypothetical protein